MVEALLADLERTIIDCLLNTFKDADALLRYDILFSALVKPRTPLKACYRAQLLCLLSCAHIQATSTHHAHLLTSLLFVDIQAQSCYKCAERYGQQKIGWSGRCDRIRASTKNKAQTRINL